jgi:hypothetical protein
MPYNPGVTDISGQLLARGITSAGDSIAGGIDQAKRDARLFKSLQEVAEVAYGIPKDVSTPWGLGQLEGRVKSEAVKRELQQAETSQRYTVAMIDQLNQQAEDRQRRAAAERGFAEDLNTLQLGPSGRSPTTADILRIGAARGVLDPRGAAGLVERLESLSGPAPGTATDIPGLPGHKFVWGSRTGGTPMPIPQPRAESPLDALDVEYATLRNAKLRREADAAAAEADQSGATQRVARATLAAKRAAIDRLEQAGAKGGRIVETEEGGFEVQPAGWLQMGDKPWSAWRAQLDQEEARLTPAPAAAPTPAPTAPAPASTPSPEIMARASAIKAAVKAGQLDKATAIKQLQALGFK